MVRGWQAAHGDLLGVIDADLQHPPEVIARLIAAMRNGADLAVGSREADGGGTSDWSFLRLLISRGSRALGKMLLPGVLGLVSDPMTGFFVVRRSAIQDVVLAPCRLQDTCGIAGSLAIQEHRRGWICFSFAAARREQGFADGFCRLRAASVAAAGRRQCTAMTSRKSVSIAARVRRAGSRN